MRMPIPSEERRRITQELGELARQLDAEAGFRRPRSGTWNAVVNLELLRAAGQVRLLATLVMNGSLSTPRAHFHLIAVRAYLALVQRADSRGVIQ